MLDLVLPKSLRLFLALMMLGGRLCYAGIFSINSVSQIEGSPPPANSQFQFTVTLSAGSGTVDYTTRDGTALSGASADYAPASGTLTFTAPGTKTVIVYVHTNTSIQPNRVFYVVLKNPSSGNSISTSTPYGTGTILDDDGWGFSVNDVVIAEGDAGDVTNAVFTVSLNKAYPSAATVHYATTDGTAHAGTDYTAVSGTLSFPIGAVSQTVSVPVLGNNAVDGNRTFTFDLSSPSSGTSLVDSSGTGWIIDDDGTTDPKWRVVANNGFGDTNNFNVFVFTSFKGALYAGVDHTPGQGSAQVWTSTDGKAWTRTGLVLPNTTTNVSGFLTTSLGGGILYLETPDATLGGGVYKTEDGQNWVPLNIGGFGNTSYGQVPFPDLVVYEYPPGTNDLYAGVTGEYAGSSGTNYPVQVWRIAYDASGPTAAWEKVVDFNTSSPGPLDTTIIMPEWMSIWNNTIYLTASAGFLCPTGGGARLFYTTNGAAGTWSERYLQGGYGFGDCHNVLITSLTDHTYGGIDYLYLPTRNPTFGGELWRTSDLVTFAEVDKVGGVNAFGNGTICSGLHWIHTYFGQIWQTDEAATNQYDRLWNSYDGVTWTQHNATGFGSSVTGGHPDVIGFGDSMYYGGGEGTSTGAQIWQYRVPVIQFGQTSFSVPESGGSADIPLTRTVGTKGPATVGLSFGGTAVLNTDYTASTTGPITFSDGMTSQTLTITIIPDSTCDGDKSATITLVTPREGAILGSPTVATVAITDDLPASPGSTLRASKSATVDLSWSAAYGASSYNVKRCNSGAGPCTPATIAAPTGTSYSDGSAPSNAWYTVEAANPCGATP